MKYDEQKEYDELPERISTSFEANIQIMQARPESSARTVAKR